jgi:hypothetical protein
VTFGSYELRLEAYSASESDLNTWVKASLPLNASTFPYWSGVLASYSLMYNPGAGFVATLAGANFQVDGHPFATFLSPDGVTWTTFYDGSQDDIGPYAFGNGLFVKGTFSEGPRLQVSKDGIYWTKSQAYFSKGVINLRFIRGKFYAFEYTRNTIYSSADGMQWTLAFDFNVGVIKGQVPIFGVRDLAYDGEAVWVALASTSNDSNFRFRSWFFFFFFFCFGFFFFKKIRKFV